jgi:hypothetical protein
MFRQVTKKTEAANDAASVQHPLSLSGRVGRVIVVMSE